MALKEPVPGLRRIFHNSNTSTKVQLNVPAGDELEVSDEVAAQLSAADAHFIDADQRDLKERQAAERAEEAKQAEARDLEEEEIEPTPADAVETIPAAKARTKGRK